MITASADFIAEVEKNGRHFDAKILKSDMTEVYCNIRDLQIQKGAFGDQVFSVGSVFSSMLTAVVDDLEEPLENEEIEVKIGVLLGDGTYDYITIGHWTVTQTRATTHQTAITGFGAIAAKLGGTMPAVTPQTLDNIAAAITATSGVPVSFTGYYDSTLRANSGILRTLQGILRARGRGGSHTDEVDLSIEGLTCRDALEVLAGAVGGFATENAEGGIEVHSYTEPYAPIEAGPDRSLSPPELADNDFVMTGISITGAAGTYSAGDPIRQAYDNPYMTEELFTDYVSGIVGYTFRPGSVPLSLGDPRIEPWDHLTVEDLDGNLYDVPCHQIQHTFDGGFSTQIYAVGEAEAEQQVKTPIIKRLEAAEEQTKENTEAIDTLTEQIEETSAYFWYKNGTGSEVGAHITEIPQTEFEEAPSGSNVYIDANVVNIRDGQNVSARFGATETQIGHDSDANLYATSDALALRYATDRLFEVSYDAEKVQLYFAESSLIEPAPAEGTKYTNVQATEIFHFLETCTADTTNMIVTKDGQPTGYTLRAQVVGSSTWYFALDQDGDDITCGLFDGICWISQYGWGYNARLEPLEEVEGYVWMNACDGDGNFGFTGGFYIEADDDLYNAIKAIRWTDSLDWG